MNISKKNKSQVTVHISNGLGNKMFHYAFGHSLKAKGFDVNYYITSLRPNGMVHEDLNLKNVFPSIDLPLVNNNDFKWFYNYEHKKTIFPFRLLKLWGRLFHNENVFFENQYGHIPEIEKYIKNKTFFKGHWQSSKYFEHCESELRKQFIFKPFNEDKNIKLYSELTSKNSVSIHIRKGCDYDYPLFQDICTPEYYRKAIQYIQDHVENPVFYVFTDNPKWIEENLPLKDFTLVDWNEPEGPLSFRDMQLMATSKHNIIANSTYSWWGAWLNLNPDKVVISPKIFFNPVNDFFKTSDVIPDSWIKI